MAQESGKKGFISFMRGGGKLWRELTPPTPPDEAIKPQIRVAANAVFYTNFSAGLYMILSFNLRREHRVLSSKNERKFEQWDREMSGPGPEPAGERRRHFILTTPEWQGSSPCFTSWPLLDLFSRAEEIYYKTNKGDPIFPILQQYWGRQSVELDDERDKSVSQSVSKHNKSDEKLRTENWELRTGSLGFWVFN